jgi:hypothetical protein
MTLYGPLVMNRGPGFGAVYLYKVTPGDLVPGFGIVKEVDAETRTISWRDGPPSTFLPESWEENHFEGVRHSIIQEYPL